MASLPQWVGLLEWNPLLRSYYWGLFSASFVERYEFGPIDDNVIATASTILLIIGVTFGPIV